MLFAMTWFVQTLQYERQISNSTMLRLCLVVFPDTILGYKKSVINSRTVNLSHNFEIPGDARNILQAILNFFFAGLVPTWLDPVPGSTAVTGSSTNNAVESRLVRSRK